MESEAAAAAEGNRKKNKKIVVVMGATGTGKSQLAIDLAAHLRGVEVVNADSMQVYHGLDVLTNQVPISQRDGVPHHLLGTLDPAMEFTSREFRNAAVPIIEDILDRNCLPLIVGGTNYYIQALVSPFLADDVVGDTDADMDACFSSISDLKGKLSDVTYERLKEIDPLAANRIHPNDHRKIIQYVNLYESIGVIPSDFFQGKSAKNWGRADEFRYNCCFIWLDASDAILDKFIDQRVDCMIEAGLLEEVHDIYKPNTDYTRGLFQAIGVREFEAFFRSYFSNMIGEGGKPLHAEQDIERIGGSGHGNSLCSDLMVQQPQLSKILESGDSKLRLLLLEAIDRLKANTRRLARRQKRRLKRLETYFGWKFYHFDVSETLACISSGSSGDSWEVKVVDPCVDVVNAFLAEGLNSSFDQTRAQSGIRVASADVAADRDLWSQYTCEACGNRVLRGGHEWKQHNQGRAHRKRMSRLRRRSEQNKTIAEDDGATGRNFILAPS